MYTYLLIYLSPLFFLRSFIEESYFLIFVVDGFSFFFCSYSAGLMLISSFAYVYRMCAGGWLDAYTRRDGRVFGRLVLIKDRAQTERENVLHFYRPSLRSLHRPR